MKNFDKQYSKIEKRSGFDIDYRIPTTEKYFNNMTKFHIIRSKNEEKKVKQEINKSIYFSFTFEYL